MSLSNETSKTFHVKVCRICLQSNCVDSVTLDYENGWLQRFEYCFGLSLSDEDEPRILCHKCAYNIAKYSTFKINCYKSHKMWKSFSSEECYVKIGSKQVVKNEIVENETNNTDCIDNTETETNSNNDNEDCLSDIEIKNEIPYSTLWEQMKNKKVAENKLSEVEPQIKVPVRIGLNNLVSESEIQQSIVPGNIVLANIIRENKVPDSGNSVKEDKREVCNNNNETEIFEIKTETNLNDVLANITEETPNEYSSSNSNKGKILTTNKKMYKCKKCLKSYISKGWYLTHRKECKEKKPKNLDQRIGKVMEQFNHMAIQNSEEDSNVTRQDPSKFCGICKYSSDSVDSINRHLHEHWTNNDLQCTLCMYLGKDQAAIAAHRYSHCSLKSHYYICHICQAKSKAQLSLQFHYRKVHLEKSGGLCSHSQCDKVYEKIRYWKRHERMHYHPGYFCDICGQKHAIVEHLMHHTNLPKYVCDVCGKRFKRASHMTYHKQNVHVKSDPQVCSHCNKTFKNQRKLNHHMKQVQREKLYKCEHCPKEYTVPCLLSAHMKTHSNDRPYCCHVCGLRYKRKSYLTVHLRVHTGLNPYECFICAKTFPSSTGLKRHMTIHTEAQQKCVRCDKTFRSRKRMVKHCLERHNLDLDNMS
ncbi:uncharacterized protein LOC142975395 isoform X2 [Anticarsia gemmatalis]|uniref:uncharacterized protein LOC142975395 isoform X2 n=1 Tax=Anticarsia gemmatalis TaxID=129554 RepID=UPI003F760C07